MSGASRAGSVRLPPLAPAVLAAAEQVDKIRPSRVGIDETVMTTGKLTVWVKCRNGGEAA
jgi:hypothetical protein